MDLFYICFLTIAISLDGFFVGITYGMRKIKVGILPLCIISITSGLMIMLTMAVGNTIVNWISPRLAEILGALILIAVGIFISYQTFKSFLMKKDLDTGYSIEFAEKENKEPLQIFSWNIKPLGIIINILREPVKADFDSSGSISSYEAIFLGLALALDALGAGFGAALSGFNPLWVPILVVVTKFIFLYVGNFLGNSVSSLLNSRLGYLSGITLIILGLIKLI